MSTFQGKQFKGAMKAHRDALRSEAEERNAQTAPERRRKYRTDPAHRLAVDALKAAGAVEADAS